MSDIQDWQKREISRLIAGDWDYAPVAEKIVTACDDEEDWKDLRNHFLWNQTAEEALSFIKRRGAEVSAYALIGDNEWRQRTLSKLDESDFLYSYVVDLINTVPDEESFHKIVQELLPSLTGSKVVCEQSDKKTTSGYLLEHKDFDYLPSNLKREMPDRIKQITEIGQDFRTLESLSELDLVRAIGERFPHCSSMLEGICKDLERRWFMGSDVITLTPALLVGPPGVGKTVVAREIAKTLGLYSREANIGGSSDAFIFGLSAGWHSAHPGIVTEAVAAACVLNPLIILDEIDKTLTSNRGGDIQAELLSLLEPAEARRYHERYLKASVDASHVSWILTANSLDTISEPLKSRCRIYHIPAPTAEQIPMIIRSLVRGYADDHGLRPEFFSLDIAETEALTATYEKKKSVRILGRMMHAYLHQKNMHMRSV